MAISWLSKTRSRLPHAPHESSASSTVTKSGFCQLESEAVAMINAAAPIGRDDNRNDDRVVGLNDKQEGFSGIRGGLRRPALEQRSHQNAEIVIVTRSA